MGILTRALPIIAAAIGIAFIANVLYRPSEATGTAVALETTGAGVGSSLGAIGRGGQALGEGIGGAGVGLLRPFWEIKNLLEAFGGTPSATQSTNLSGGGANTSPVAQNSNAARKSNQAQTITWSDGQSTTLPAGSLSPQARAYYSALGVRTT